MSERVLRLRITPLTRRRWQNFKANRRGFFSLLGLVMGLIGDLMYTVIDPRITFERVGA